MRFRWLAVLAAAATTGCGYNTIQTYDEQAAQAKQQIDVQLRRRADLIPNMVATVKGYAAHEEAILTEVSRAHSGLVGALNRPGGGDPQELANANAGVTRAMGPFLTLVQAYPQLKADQQFMRLQDELTGTENRIAVARTDYNQAVQQYNTYIRRMPAALTAKVTGAKTREYFEETDPAARTVPKVDFGNAPPAGGTPSPAAGGGAPAGGGTATPPPATP